MDARGHNSLSRLQIDTLSNLTLTITQIFMHDLKDGAFFLSMQSQTVNSISTCLEADRCYICCLRNTLCFYVLVTFILLRKY